MDDKFTEKQEKLLDCLFNEAKGDFLVAYRMAGYAEGNVSQVLKALKDEIIDRAFSVLASHSPKAIVALVDALGEGSVEPGVVIKLQAAQQILDRVGLSKKEKLSVDVQGQSGIFILPAKGIPNA